ncbi:MAG: hypothetical protein IKM61_03775 [Eubacteriaceae bacterium]|nr:hypothetical protein [Eubacteriaceae bacterium]
MKKKVIAIYGIASYIMLAPYVLATLGLFLYILYCLSKKIYTSKRDLTVMYAGMVATFGLVCGALVAVFRFYVVTDKYIKDKDALWITHKTIDLTSVREIGISPNQETFIIPDGPIVFERYISAFPRSIYFSERELTEKERRNLQYTARDKNIKIEFIEITNQSKKIIIFLENDFGISVIR